MKDIVIDIETNGISYDNSEIIMISLCRISDHIHDDDIFYSFIRPSGIISDLVWDLTGLPQDQVMQSPVFADALLTFIGDARLVAPRMGFERAFLNAELTRCGRQALPPERFHDLDALAPKLPASENNERHDKSVSIVGQPLQAPDMPADLRKIVERYWAMCR